MTSDQIAAFNNASSTQVSELYHFLVLVLFVVVCTWSVVMFIGKLKALVLFMQGNVNYTQYALGVIQILAVIMIVLYLVH